jgi:hypothetical protein
MERINTLCGQNSELWYVKAGGTYSYHCAATGLEEDVGRKENKLKEWTNYGRGCNCHEYNSRANR